MSFIHRAFRHADILEDGTDSDISVFSSEEDEDNPKLEDTLETQDVIGQKHEYYGVFKNGVNLFYEVHIVLNVYIVNSFVTNQSPLTADVQAERGESADSNILVS